MSSGGGDQLSNFGSWVQNYNIPKSRMSFLLICFPTFIPEFKTDKIPNSHMCDRGWVLGVIFFIFKLFQSIKQQLNFYTEKMLNGHFVINIDRDL